MIESVLPEVFERSRKPLLPPQIDLKQWRSVPRRRGRKSNMSPMIVFYISHRPYTTTPRSFRDCRWITSVPCIDQCLEDLSGLCRLTGTQAIWNTTLWLLIWEFAKVSVSFCDFFGGERNNESVINSKLHSMNICFFLSAWFWETCSLFWFVYFF